MPEQHATEILKSFRSVDPGWREVARVAREHAAQAPQPKLTKVLITSEGVPAVRLHTQGGDFLPDTHFLERGDPNRKKDGVAPRRASSCSGE